MNRAVLPSYLPPNNGDQPRAYPGPFRYGPGPGDANYPLVVLQLGLTYASMNGECPLGWHKHGGRPGPRGMSVANRQHVVPTSFNLTNGKDPVAGKSVEDYSEFVRKMEVKAPLLYSWFKDRDLLLDVSTPDGVRTIINADQPSNVHFSCDDCHRRADLEVEEKSANFRKLVLGSGHGTEEKGLLEWLQERANAVDTFREILRPHRYSLFYGLARLRDLWAISSHDLFELLDLHNRIAAMESTASFSIARFDELGCVLDKLILLKCLARAWLVWETWVQLGGALRTRLKKVEDALKTGARIEQNSLADILRPWLNDLVKRFEVIIPIENIIDTILLMHDDVVPKFHETMPEGVLPRRRVRTAWKQDDTNYWLRLIQIFYDIYETADWPVNWLENEWTPRTVATYVAPQDWLEKELHRLMDRIHDSFSLRLVWATRSTGSLGRAIRRRLQGRVARMAIDESRDTVMRLFEQEPTGKGDGVSFRMLERADKVRFKV